MRSQFANAMSLNICSNSFNFGCCRFFLRHWCAIPELDSALNLSSSIPGYVGDPGGYPSWAVPVDKQDGGATRPSQCMQYKVNFTEVHIFSTRHIYFQLKFTFLLRFCIFRFYLTENRQTAHGPPSPAKMDGAMTTITIIQLLSQR
jgi:hypothetical protein